MIHHIVSWKLNGADAATVDAQATEITAALDALVGVVPTIKSFTVGRNIVHTDASYDLVLVSEFDSVDDLTAYQVHPAHIEVAGLIAKYAVTRSVVDFER
jgi:hypothetical protein